MWSRWKCVLFCGFVTSSLIAQQVNNSTSSQFFTAFPAKGPGASQAPEDALMEAMPQVAPLFIQDDTTSSSVVVVNNSAIPAGATIGVVSLDGKIVSRAYRLLAPHEQQEISLQSLLIDAEPSISIGSVLVTQDESLKGMTVISQVLITSNRGFSSYVDEELAMPSMSGSATLRGVADEAFGEALIAVTNLEKTPQHVAMRCLSAKGEKAAPAISLGPRETGLFVGCSGPKVGSVKAYLASIGEENSGGVEAFELTNDGGPGTIAAFGLAPHMRKQDIVFSAVTFADPKLIYSPNIAFAGVPVGPQPTLPDGVYSPRLALSNFSSNPAQVSITAALTSENQAAGKGSSEAHPMQQNVQQLMIPPRHTAEILLDDLGQRSGLLQSLLVDTDRQAGDVAAKVVSRSDGTLHEIELLAKDRLDENNGGIHPWSVEGDYESHLLLFNHSGKPQDFGVGIWNGEILWDKKYTLVPFETREISFNELIRDKVTDNTGQILDAEHQRGVVNWMVPDSGTATGRLMVTSRFGAQARNFSCGQYIVVCGMVFQTAYGGFLPANDTLALYGSFPQFCDEFSPSQCTGGSSVGSGSASLSWRVGASSVVTTSSPTAQWPPLYGVAPGTGYANVTACAGSCCSNGGGSPTVVPAVTFSPSFSGIAKGGTQTVTVTLNNASTSPSPITLKLTTTSGTGAAIFISGGTIAPGGASTTIASNTAVVIQGVTASSTAGNIRLDASLISEGQSSEDATNPFTFSVVSVALSLQTSGPPTVRDSDFPFSSLGVQVDYSYPAGSSSCPAPFQVTGTVTPSNYPGGIFLRRTVLGGVGYQDPGGVIVSTISQRDDTSDPSLEPTSGGSIYDLDAPALSFKNVPVGTTLRYRVNFDEYAVLGTGTSTIKVSTQDLPFFIRTSCQLASTVSVTLDTTYPGDNQIGAGSTATSENLQ